MICPECGTRLPVGISKCHFCGNEISPAKETSFIDKFIALFTFMALFVAAVVMFYTFYQGQKSYDVRVVASLVSASLLILIYWLVSPFAIKYLIDPIIKK